MWYMIRLILEAVFSDEDSNWGPRIRNSKVKFETKTGLTWTRMFVMYLRRYYAMRGAHINFEQNSPKVLLSSSICLLPYQPERWSLSTGYQLELRGDSLKILSLMYKHPHVWRTTLNLHCTPARHVGVEVFFTVQTLHVQLWVTTQASCILMPRPDWQTEQLVCRVS